MATQTTGGLRLPGDETIRMTTTCAKAATTGVFAPYRVAQPLTPIVTATGVASAQVSALYLYGVGDQNSTSRVVTVELTDVAGTRYVKIYKEAAKTTLLGSGSNAGDGTFALTAAAGQGVYGYVTVVYTADEDSYVTVYGAGQVYITKLIIAHDSGTTDNPVLFSIDYGATAQIYAAASTTAAPLELRLENDTPGANKTVNITVTSATDGVYVTALGWQRKPS